MTLIGSETTYLYIEEEKQNRKDVARFVFFLFVFKLTLSFK